MIDSLTRIIQTSLLQLHGLSVTAMALAALISPLLFGPPELMARLLAFTGLFASLNLVLTLVARRLGGAEGAPMLFSPFPHLGMDLLAWGAYLFLSGGATNPLISIFLALVAIGALILDPRRAWLLALAAVLLYSFLWYWYIPLSIPDYQMAIRLHLFGMWLVFAFAAVLVVWFILHLSEGIRRRDQALAAARERRLRDDWLISLASQAAGAAHELSTPLATLHLLADELLADDRLPAPLAIDVQTMQAQVQRCKATLGQLAARAGQCPVETAPHRPARAWLEDTLLAWQSQHPHMAVHLDVDPELDGLSLPGDPALERTLTHLLDNGVKARARRLDVGASVTAAGSLEIRVADDGHGMSPAALAAFHRRQPAVSAQGLGVGLLLGLAAVERRGGSLSLSSPGPDGTGTLARLCLPLEQTQEPGHGG